MSGRRAKFLVITTLVSASIVTYMFGANERATKVGLLPSTWSQPHVQPPEIVAEDELFVPLQDVTHLPETSLVKSIAGFNYFHNLYLLQGTWYFVSDDPAAAGFPEAGAAYFMTDISKGSKKDMPGDDMFRVISTPEAREILGKIAVRRTGVSLYFNDGDSEGPAGNKVRNFLDHYYHFGEMFLGLWRLTVAAGDFELPSRLMYRAEPKAWRDKARIITWFQRTILATTQLEEVSDWEDRRESKLTFLYEKIGIADRWAAHNHGKEVGRWNKANADLPSLEVPLNWMSPMRGRVVLLSEASGCKVERKHPNVPVVTYIDRQKTGRRLVGEDHELLLQSLQLLDTEGVIEFHHAQMETMDRISQFCLAARTDIMVGVHGNGLSHQLWMQPGSGVLELMFVGGFTRDYAILAEMMSHEYYAVHNNTYLPHDKWIQENGRPVGQIEGFHGKSIRVYGPYVAALVKDMAIRRRHGSTPVQW